MEENKINKIIQNKINLILESLLNLIYPPVCSFCGKIDKNFLCEDCKKEIEKIKRIRRIKNHDKSKKYEELIYMFKYKYIRENILKYKFNNKAYFYKTFVKIILNDKKLCHILKSYDIIIPVPIHKKRRKERGYNQTELIAKALSLNIKELEYKDVLIKRINTKAQSTLNRKQRLENLKNVYEIKEDRVEELKEKNILIFDDIYTTGTTVNECAKLINKYNVNKIGIFTIAKD